MHDTVNLSAAAVQAPASERVSSPWRMDPVEFRAQLFWGFWACILPCIGMAPMLAVHLRKTLDLPHLQFYPLSFALAGWLLASTCKLSCAVGWRGWLVRCMTIVGIIAGLAGIFLYSFFTVYLAWAMVMFAWALGAFGATPWTRLVAIFSLIFVTIPLPFGLDLALIQKLQAVATWACSGFLDIFQLPHLLDGNVIEIQAKRLFVEEACSGIDSLYALTAVGLALTVMSRRPLVVGILVLLSVPIWSLAGNVLRILTIVYSLEYFNFDMSTGTVHTILGLVLFALSAVCLLLTDLAISSLFQPIYETTVTSRIAGLYDRIVTWPDPQAEVSEAATQSTAKSFARTFPVFSVAIVILGLGCFGAGVLSTIALMMSDDALLSVDTITEAQAELFPAETAVPQRFRDLNRVAYKPELRSNFSTYGKYSHTWQMDQSGSPVIVSLDFPFTGWHAVSVCYTATGWTILDTQSHDMVAQDGTPWTLEEFQMRNDYGQFGYVIYAHFDESGAPVSRASVANWMSKRSLFVKLGMKKSVGLESAASTRFQVQMFYEAAALKSEEEKAAARQSFSEMFDLIRSQSTVALKQIKG